MSRKSKLIVRLALALLMVVVLTAGLASRVEAVVINRDGVIPAGVTVDDDVVMAATFIKVEGTVNGALIAAGQSVTITGVVKGDVIAMAQSVLIDEKAVIDGNLFFGGSSIQVRGKIGGSIFGGGMALSLDDKASVGRNLFFGGYSLEAKPGSKVTRDLYAAGYQLALSGTARNLVGAAAAIEINGTVEGNVDLTVAEPGWPGSNTHFWQNYQPALPAQIQPGLRISEGAKIGGKLTYTSEADQSSAIQASPAGGIVFQTPVPDQRRANRGVEPIYTRTTDLWGGFWLWAVLRHLAMILILGALALWLVPGVFQRTLAVLRQRSLASLAVGLLELIVVLFAIPMVSIALIMLAIIFGITTLFDLTGIILSLGFALLVLAVVIFFILFGWAGKLAISYIIGNWILSKLSPQAAPHRFWQFALGAVIFVLLAAIPFVGFLFVFLVDLAGVGALWYVWRNRSV